MYINGKGYVIKCPYCFGEFPQEDTIFRAHTAFDRTQLYMNDDDDMDGLLKRKGKNSSRGDDKELFQRFDGEGGQKQDEKLIKYWKERGGKSGYATTDPTWDYPHIDPNSPDFRRMICTESCGTDTIDERGFIVDPDGFIMRVIDKYYGQSKPMERLCPHCHNPMPLADYGKYPEKFIGVIGMTGAGKTVFLNQLLTRFSAEIGTTDFNVTTNNLNTVGESINANQPLPAATDNKVMRRPFAVTLEKKGGSIDDHMTLIFYDIAGENCINEKGEPDVASAKAVIGKFIAYCDGMIFLLDPSQIPVFAMHHVPVNTIANIVSVMSDIRKEMNQNQKDWNDIPVAVCLAKSDEWKTYISDSDYRDVPIFKHSERGITDFNRQDHRKIHQFLEKFLTDNAFDVIAPLEVFQKRAFFAISAITCGVQSRFEKFQNQYILNPENERKFRNLHRWIDGWNKRSVENRPYYHVCPIRTKDGEAIQISLTDDINKWNASSIITEIEADSVEGTSIYLTLWDVAKEVNLIGYPIAAPSPLRIAEPLKWILWQMRKIGPYYPVNEPPKKKIWHWGKTYERILDAFYEEEAHNEELFYVDSH